MFAAWTDADSFCQWFGPDGFTCTVREMDVRPGGRARFDMTVSVAATVAPAARTAAEVGVLGVEVATAVGSGASNAEIAASLFMSEATVKAHVSRLLSKLDLTNRVQIAILVHDAQS